MAEEPELQDVLGSGAGGPLAPPSAWVQNVGWISYAGGVVIGSPTGGQKGPGTLNLQVIYLNGVLVNLAQYVQLTGGTMTGLLTLAVDPTNPFDAATKRYVDNSIANVTGDFGSYLPLAGGTISGNLTINGNETIGGTLTLSADPTANLQASTKRYVDNSIAPVTANFANYLPLTGGTLTGNITVNGNETIGGTLTLSADPTANLQAATKRYVDSNINTVNLEFANYLLLTGGTLTGGLTISSGTLTLNTDPTANLQAATKQYVDAKTSGIIGIPDAPSDGTAYWRNNAAWTGTVDVGTF
jgi:fibronectin-binding autotransporter adhesin